MVSTQSPCQQVSFANVSARDLNKRERNALFYLARGIKMDPVLWPECLRLVDFRLAEFVQVGSGRRLVKIRRPGRKLAVQLQLRDPERSQ